MKKILILILILSVFVLTSCEKEEEPMVLPPPGDLTKVIADIGTDYSKAVYVSLKNNTQQTRPWKDWDLAFDASEDGGYVYLNTGKFMFACHTGSTDFASVDTAGKEWRLDNDALDDDSNAIGKWWLSSLGNEVLVVDRGKIFYSGAAASQRFKKIKLEQVTDDQYIFSFCDYASSTPISFTITKDHQHSLMYFSFDNGGHTVDMSPPNEQWDFVLTRYTHIYYGEPVGSPFRNYPVNGVLNNKWNGISAAAFIKDSTAGYIPFDQMTAVEAEQFTYSNAANVIGYEWKMVDINTSTYTIVPDRYYILKDKDGYYYKLRFLDFYDDLGNRGSITFDYQRL
jgi:hypothetical protein